MVSKTSKVIAAEVVELPEVNIADIQNSLKYLGIRQANDNNEEAGRKSATTRHIQYNM